MLEVKKKVVQDGNGVTYVRKVYKDAIREYDTKAGRKKSEILEQFSVAQQLNVMRKVILRIAEQENVDASELQVIEDCINSIK
jgi:hypothetical protein